MPLNSDKGTGSLGSEKALKLGAHRQTGSIPCSPPRAKGYAARLKPLWAGLHAQQRDSYSPPGANYGGPLAAPQLELPGGIGDKSPTHSGCFAPGHVTHAQDAAASLRPVGHRMGKIIRAPWWWPDPWDIVPRVEDRISPYSGVHCNFPAGHRDSKLSRFPKA